jgi:hypothetical protein
VIREITVTGKIPAAVEGDRVFHDVAVVGDQVEGDLVEGNAGVRRAGNLTPIALNLLDQGDGEETGNGAVQQAVAIAARAPRSRDGTVVAGKLHRPAIDVARGEINLWRENAIGGRKLLRDGGDGTVQSPQSGCAK